MPSSGLLLYISEFRAEEKLMGRYSLIKEVRCGGRAYIGKDYKDLFSTDDIFLVYLK